MDTGGYMSDFINKTILVTGGAQGIGKGISEYLANKGGYVVIADIDKEAGENLAGQLRAKNMLALSISTDVGNEESVKNCISQTIDQCGKLDGLVNNAGIANPGNTAITDLSLATWNEMLRTNLTGSFLMAKYATPYLQKTGGAIVNISSTRALQSEANTEAYSASKGGLVALTHALAISLGNRVRVNSILPGWIDVRAHQKGSPQSIPPLRKEDHQQHPVGRVGMVDDVAALTGFLLSAQAAFITGQKFVIDGGMTKKMMYLDG